MGLILYTKRIFLERLKKHLNNGWPTTDFKVTDNELLLYIDQFVPFVMKGQIFENAKVTGIFEVPDAYQITYSYTISNQNSSTYEWSVTLTQTPVSLPSGYDITDVYVTGLGTGKSQSALPIKPKRQAFRNLMPTPYGLSYRVEGKTLFIKMNDGTNLFGYTLFVQLPMSRTDDLDAAMNIPDDAIAQIFDLSVKKILERSGMPVDPVLNQLPVSPKVE